MTGSSHDTQERVTPVGEDRDVIGLGTGVLVALITAAGLLACLGAVRRGIDLTDESYYILAALHPTLYLRSFTEFQLILGPVLWVVRYVWILRAVGLIALAAASAFFAIAFLRTSSTLLGARFARSDHLAVGAAVVAGALMPSVYASQTPGYNQLTVWTLLCVAGLLLLLADGRVPRNVEPAAWGAVGVLVWMQFLVKWPAVTAIVPLLALALWRTKPRPWSTQASVGMVLAGIAIAAVVTDLFVPLTALLSGMKQGNSSASTSQGGHPISVLLHQYEMQLRLLVTTFVKTYWYLIAAAVGGVVLCSKSRYARIAAISLGGALSLLTFAYMYSGRARGGVQGYPAGFVTRGSILPALVGFTLVACVTAVVMRRRVPADRRVLFIGALLVMPLLSALGTNNYIWFNALFAAAFWIAAALAMCSAAFGEFSRFPVRGLAFAISLLIAFTAVNGTWSNPYRQAPLSADTVGVSISGPLSGLSVDQAMNSFLEGARAAVVRATTSGRPPTMVVWAGLPGAAVAGGVEQPYAAWVGQDAAGATSLDEGCADHGRGVLLLKLPGAPDPVADAAALPSGCAGRAWVARETLSAPFFAELGTGQVEVFFAPPVTS